MSHWSLAITRFQNVILVPIMVLYARYLLLDAGVNLQRVRLNEMLEYDDARLRDSN
jgi:hypothetical protein